MPEEFCYVFGKWNKHRSGTPLEREGRASPGRAGRGGTVQGGRLGSPHQNVNLKQCTVRPVESLMGICYYIQPLFIIACSGVEILSEFVSRFLVGFHKT